MEKLKKRLDEAESRLRKIEEVQDEILAELKRQNDAQEEIATILESIEENISSAAGHLRKIQPKKVGEKKSDK